LLSGGKEAVSVKGTTELKVISQADWGKFHGSKAVTDGRLKAETDTDYLTFRCPQCESVLKGGNGIRLEGVDRDLGKKTEGRPALVFLLHCTKCNLRDHFKLAIDQWGRYGTGVARNGG
jgi:hypothetical protein